MVARIRFFIICCLCLPFAYGADPYQDWLSFEMPFQGQRVIPTSEMQWLKQLAAFEHSQQLTVERRPPRLVSLTTEDTESVAYQPEVLTDVDVVFTAPKTRLFINTEQAGVSIAVSGQSIVLPKLIGSEASGDFVAQLTYWLGRDLSDLLGPIKTMQQETGWSDFEVRQLMMIYSKSVFSDSQFLAFETAFWVQAGYGVHLARADDHWVLMLSLARPVRGLPMLYQASHWWALPAGSTAESVNVLSADQAYQGQSMRFTSVNDRSRTNQFERIEFWFENRNRLQSVRWEIPRHWAQVAWRPASTVERFSEPLPDFLFLQLTQLLETDDVLDQVTLMSQWLTEEFKLTEQPISIQQAFIFRAQSVETRFILLARWWRFMTNKSAALVQLGDQWALALALPDETNSNVGITQREKNWLLLSSTLKPVTDIASDQSIDWIYLP